VLAEQPDEFIVIDQSDNAQTEEVIARLESPVVRYVHSSVAGLSKAYNTGIQHARNELLAFTDDDCTVPQGWLAAVAATFEQHPDASLAYGQVLAGSIDIPTGSCIPELAFAEEVIVRPSEPFRTFGMGANYCARKSALVGVGGFDELLGGGAKFRSAQDYDMAYRLWKAGHTIVFAPELVVLHYGLRLAEQLPGQNRAYGHGDAAFYLKHARCRDGAATSLLLRKVLRELTIPVYRLVRRRPYSPDYAIGFSQGLRHSFRHPVDRQTRQYAAK